MIINKRVASFFFAVLAAANAESVDRELANRGTLNAKNAHSVANPIVVDGDITEWITGDIFKNMYKQGNADSSWKGYQLAGVAYKRVDCVKQQLCILVLAQPGFEVEGNLDNSWYKDYQSGMAGDKYTGDPGIVFVKAGGKNIGWEGCFKIPQVAITNPSRAQIEIHMNYKSGKSTTWDTGSTGKAMHGYSKMDLCVAQEAATVPVAAPVPVPVPVAAPVPVPVPVAAPVPVPVPVAAPVPVPVPVAAPVPVPVPVAAPVPVPVPVAAPVPVPVPVAAPVPVEEDINLDNANQEGEVPDEDVVDETELAPLTIDLGPANQGGGYGDPHLKTWHGKVFDFHGECDLLLTRSEKFNNGMGFEIQIRTQIRRDWSFIKEAALRIGDQVFEVTKDMVYHSNRVTHGFRRRGINHLGGHDGVLPQKIAGFPISYVNYDTKRHKFEVDMGEKGTVSFKIYGDFLSVTVQRATEDFGDAIGLMGDFVTGELKGRDGAIMTNTDDFGLDWQIRDSDNKLFTEIHGVQFPETCRMPPPEAVARRRLAESSVSYQEASKACGSVEEESKDACIFDILSTGDLGMADFDL